MSSHIEYCLLFHYMFHNFIWGDEVAQLVIESDPRAHDKQICESFSSQKCCADLLSVC